MVDACYVGSIRFMKKEAAVTPEKCRELTLVGVRIRASEKLQNVIEQFNCIACSIAPVYKGSGTGSGAWGYGKTSNPASMAMYAMQGPLAQQHIADGSIDFRSFEALYTWCHGHRYGCNEYITDSMPISELLSSIASICRSEIIRRNGLMAVIQDIGRQAPMQLFTPRNTKSYSETIAMADIPGAIAMQFTDAEAGFAENEAVVYNTPTGAMEEGPEATQDCPLWGVTSSEQARRLGMYKYACLKHRPILHKISCDFEYLMCQKGDWVQYAGDIALAGITQGRLRAVAARDGVITGCTTDEPLIMEAGKDYALRIRKSDGEIALRQIKNIPGTTYEAEFISSLMEGEIAEGDLYAFGTQGKEAIDLIVTEITPGNNLEADLTCVELSPDIFRVDDPGFVLPPFDPNITIVPPAADSGVISPDKWQAWYTYHDSVEEPSRPQKDGSFDGWHRAFTIESRWMSVKQASDVNSGQWGPPIPTSQYVNDKIESGTAISSPAIPESVRAVADKDGVALSCNPLPPGLGDTLLKFVWEVSKSGGESWAPFESTENQTAYLFDRSVDGYLEADELLTWRFRVKAVNIWGAESSGYGGGSGGVAVDIGSYGTWVLGEPAVTATVNGRSITLQMRQPSRSDRRTVYGEITHRIQIQKPPADTGWSRPAQSLNPYESEGNYKEGEGFVSAGAVYTQTMPLTGQTIKSETVDGKEVRKSAPEATLYRFRITAVNEAGGSEAAIINATALGTDIMDLVQGSVTHDKISTPSLSAISGNLGVISGGSFGDEEDNHWALSTVELESGKKYKGDFRAGGANQFIHVEPIVVNDEVTDYKITIQVGSFQISSEASKINGEIIVQKDENSFDRTRITPTGTYYEYRPSPGSPWQAIAKQETRGTVSQLLYGPQSLVVTNTSIAKRRSLLHDIGRPYLSPASRVYHFDTDVLDQYGKNGCTVGYDGDPPVLVGEEDNTPSSTIDFTPAILAVAPYSEIGKSLYGQYSLTHPIGVSQQWTVDLWVQYIWAENQVLLDIGAAEDKIQIIISTGEPNYNEPIKADAGNGETEDEPPYNYEPEGSGSPIYNVPESNERYIFHQGLSTFEAITFAEAGISFETNQWLHLAVVLTPNTISAYINDKEFVFNRYSKAEAEASVSLNNLKGPFILDELMVDNTAAEPFEDFADNTKGRIPWAGLDYKEPWLVIDGEKTANIKTNLFKSPDFTPAFTQGIANSYLQLINMLHPVGSVLFVPSGELPSSDPNKLFPLTTWEKLTAYDGRVAQAMAEAKREAGLPNISGGFKMLTLESPEAEGAFYQKRLDDGWEGLDTNEDVRLGYINFDASRSSPIYGKSSTVQPPAFGIIIFKRVK